MFSWLNFEELLIHNPIELINPSKDTISVAMSKKQYIEFFSNKYTYNGVYYDEEMDFCLFYYADPLQSVKDGDVYAQGYIDVEMKIYRVKWLCNVSISSPSGLLQTTDGTQGVPQEGGKYTHTAWSYSADGKDRFSTIYPRYNLLEGSKKYTKEHPYVLSSAHADGNAWLKDVHVKNLKAGTYTLSAKSDAPWIGHNHWPSNERIGKVGLWLISTQTWEWINLDTVPQTIEVHKDGDYFIRVNTYSNGRDIETHSFWDFKLEQGSLATPYMPSESEATKSDRPSYIGQYTDYTLEDSTNPSSYTWRELREDKWNVTKTEMVVNSKSKTITTVLNGILSKYTKDKDITGWRNLPPNENYNYRQPQYSLDIGADDFIISGFGLRGLKNG
jgi:hypothetical protein